MRLYYLLLVFVCLVALTVAKKEKRKGPKNLAAKEGRNVCQRSFEGCKKAAKSKVEKLSCKTELQACKDRVKAILTDLKGVKIGNQKKGKKRGGPKRRPGPKQQFCQCFKKLVGCIKKHHNKSMTDSDGQKITIHEEIFSNAKIAVSGNVEENAESKEMPAALGGKKKCLQNFKCCLQRRCGQKGKKGQGGKARRRNRGANKLAKQNKGAKGGKRPQKSPFASCIAAGKSCKEKAGKSKKQLKACAKAFVKCILGKCKKG